MKSVILAIVLTFLATLALLWAGAAGLAWAGTVDVAATADYLPGAEWFFSTLSERSIRRHAAEALEDGRIELPERVTAELVSSGASHYGSMCVPCHGAPGVPRGEMGQGMKPQPPELSQVAREMSSAEIYWVLEHGIRHTGMPAFGATHSADELWGLVAFVEQLDGMSPDEYQRITRAAGDSHAHGGNGGHGHGGGESQDHHGGSQGGQSQDRGAPAAEGAAGEPSGEATQDDHSHEGDGHQDHAH